MKNSWWQRDRTKFFHSRNSSTIRRESIREADYQLRFPLKPLVHHCNRVPMSLTGDPWLGPYCTESIKRNKNVCKRLESSDSLHFESGPLSVCTGGPIKCWISSSSSHCKNAPRLSERFAFLGIMGAHLRAPLIPLGTIVLWCLKGVSGGHLIDPSWGREYAWPL